MLKDISVVNRRRLSPYEMPCCLTDIQIVDRYKLNAPLSFINASSSSFYINRRSILCSVHLPETSIKKRHKTRATKWTINNKYHTVRTNPKWLEQMFLFYCHVICADSMTPLKYVTNYDPRTGISVYKLTPSLRYPPNQTHWDTLTSTASRSLCIFTSDQWFKSCVEMYDKNIFTD